MRLNKTTWMKKLNEKNKNYGKTINNNVVILINKEKWKKYATF